MKGEIRLYDHGSPDYYLALELRRELLRTPLGLDFSELEIAEESNQVFMGAFESGEAIGTLTLVLNGKTCKMRQVAVDSTHQGHGVGSKLVEFAEKWAKQNGFERMDLHARKTAVHFYQSQGYAILGAEFIEVTIPHFKMTKALL